MKYLAVKDFREHQHYRDRNPVWIKLYNRVMDNDDFLSLSDAARSHLILIWLLASRRHNKIPNDAKLIARAIQATSRVNVSQLVQLGFLIPWEASAEAEEVASKIGAEPEEVAALERETEIETEGEPAKSQPPQGLGAPGAAEEQRFAERAPEAYPVALRFLDGKDDTARMAWFGRFHGAMDRPPHPTGAELRDALEDLMTEPRDKWNPAMFRSYVGRIKRDAKREAERAAAPSRGFAGASNIAVEAGWQIVLSMIPAWHRREVTAETIAALPEPIQRGISAAGGFRVISETPEHKRVWKKQEFATGFSSSPQAGAA